MKEVVNEDYTLLKMIYTKSLESMNENENSHTERTFHFWSFVQKLFKWKSLIQKREGSISSSKNNCSSPYESSFEQDIIAQWIHNHNTRVMPNKKYQKVFLLFTRNFCLQIHFAQKQSEVSQRKNVFSRNLFAGIGSHKGPAHNTWIINVPSSVECLLNGNGWLFKAMVNYSRQKVHFLNFSFFFRENNG